MPHDVSLIATIAAGLGLALVMGFAGHARRRPAPGGLPRGRDHPRPGHPRLRGRRRARPASWPSIGVMLMMFGVGLHFSLDDLLAVRRIAVPGAMVQIVVATALGAATVLSWGWSLGAGIVFGLSLSVASTVVLLRALEARGLLRLGQRADRRGLAGGRGPGRGGGAGAAAGPGRPARRRGARGDGGGAERRLHARGDAGQGRRVRGAHARRRDAACSRGCSGWWHAPARGSSSPWR